MVIDVVFIIMTLSPTLYLKTLAALVLTLEEGALVDALFAVDREMIDVMVKSGLSGIYFGIESGSPKIQKTTNKNLDLNKTIDIIQYSISKQLSITASFIYGFPEESELDLESTLQLMFDLIKIGVKNVQMHRLSIENGTALFEK